MDQFIELLIEGVVVGAGLAIGAVGITIVYGGLKIINFAQGDYMTLGAFIGVTASGVFRLNLVVGIVLGAIGTAVFALVVEFLLWRPLRKRNANSFGYFVTAIGVSLILRQSVLFIWGPSYRHFDISQYSTISLWGIKLPITQVIAGAIGIPALFVTAFLFNKLRIGKEIRGLADSRELVVISGISSERLSRAIWLISGLLAGLGGVLLGLVEGSFNSNLGWNQLLPMFCAVVLGGIGSVYGALLGGLFLGIVMEVTTWSGFAGGVPPNYALLIAFALLIGVLLIRPTGFLGQEDWL